MKTIEELKSIKDLSSITKQMYRNGWHEINSGNISVRLLEEEIKDFIPENGYKTKIFPLDIDASFIHNQYFLITGTGKYFRNIHKDPELNIGIIKILEDGKHYQMLWGFRDGKGPTSELNTHLLVHSQRQKINPDNRVVMHAHPTNILAMTHIHDLDEKSFTRTLWKMCTESIVVFPDGVSVLPWMLCGTKEIGYETAHKIKDSRIVVWTIHGVFAVGNSLDDAYGLIETVEKSAEVYLKIKDYQIINELSDDNLRELATYFKVDVKKDYLK